MTQREGRPVIVYYYWGRRGRQDKQGHPLLLEIPQLQILNKGSRQLKVPSYN